MTKQLSAHAAAAKMIRQEIKKHGIKASVKASTYSGGSSIRVNLKNELPATAQKIREYVSQFEYGTFDGMTDCYNIDNSRDDIPQVKFTFVNNEYSDDLRQEAWDFANKTFGLNLEGDYSEFQNKMIEPFQKWGSDVLWQVLSGHIEGFWTSRKPRIKAA